MQGLLAKLSANQQKTPNLGSRSASVASSIDDREDQNEESDESQSQQSLSTLKPKIKKEKKVVDVAKSKEVKPKVASRINTNMVKLKLLDATRKAIIDKTKKTFESAYVQTETFKTKLCKDQSIENQNDLISKCDESTETDIEFTATRAKDGTLFVTTTCAVNTDVTSVESVSTQTAMPRSNVSFKKLLETKQKIQYLDDEELTIDGEESDDQSRELIRIEKRLRSKKKLSRQKSQSPNIEEMMKENVSFPTIADKTVKTKEGGEDSDSEFEDDSIQENVIKKHHESKRNATTFDSWHDLKHTKEKIELPRSYFSDGPTPWSNFQDCVFSQRFLNARLSPIPQKAAQANLRQETWSDSQVKVVSDLIKEANALMNMFDQVAMLLGPDVKLHNVSDVEEFKLPKQKFTEEMKKKTEKLEASLKRLHDMK